MKSLNPRLAFCYRCHSDASPWQRAPRAPVRHHLLSSADVSLTDRRQACAKGAKTRQKDIKTRVSSQIGVTRIELSDDNTHMIAKLKYRFSIEMVLN